MARSLLINYMAAASFALRVALPNGEHVVGNDAGPINDVSQAFIVAVNRMSEENSR